MYCTCILSPLHINQHNLLFLDLDLLLAYLQIDGYLVEYMLILINMIIIVAVFIIIIIQQLHHHYYRHHYHHLLLSLLTCLASGVGLSGCTKSALNSSSSKKMSSSPSISSAHKLSLTLL